MRLHPVSVAVRRRLLNDSYVVLMEMIMDDVDCCINEELSREVVLKPFDNTKDSDDYLAKMVMIMNHHARMHAKSMRRILAWLESEGAMGPQGRRLRPHRS
jgi:hypothetical protein